MDVLEFGSQLRIRVTAVPSVNILARSFWVWRTRSSPIPMHGYPVGISSFRSFSLSESKRIIPYGTGDYQLRIESKSAEAASDDAQLPEKIVQRKLFAIPKVDVLDFMCYPTDRKERSTGRERQCVNAKLQIAALLEEADKEYLSGNAIAEELGITRAAVWKCIRQMEEEGYRVEVTRKGYRLSEESDAISKNAVLRYLGDAAPLFKVEVLSEVDSTNTYFKRMAPELKAAGGRDATPWRAVIAGSQSAGRGRLGRTFASPAGSGVYLSVFLTPRLSAQQAVRITTAAAVAACRAIEACTAGESPERQPRIKWVNDILVDGKKTCGILTEASIDLESGSMDWAIMGIGFNVYEPEGGFPEELKTIAGPIALTRRRDLRSRIAAAFLESFREVYTDVESGSFAEEYKARSFLIGKPVYVIRNGEARPATACDIDDECRLLVRYEDGSSEALSSGEVSVRPAS